MVTAVDELVTARRFGLGNASLKPTKRLRLVLMKYTSDSCGPRCAMPSTFDYFSRTGGLFHTVAMMSEAMKRTIKPATAAARVIQTCDHAVGASHTQMTASAAMMAITTAMKVLDL